MGADSLIDFRRSFKGNSGVLRARVYDEVVEGTIFFAFKNYLVHLNADFFE